MPTGCEIEDHNISNIKFYFSAKLEADEKKANGKLNSRVKGKCFIHFILFI